MRMLVEDESARPGKNKKKGVTSSPTGEAKPVVFEKLVAFYVGSKDPATPKNPFGILDPPE